MIFGWILLALALTACQNEVEVVQRSIADIEYVPAGIRIETAEELVKIGLYDQYPADGTYYLGNDIDLSVLWQDKADYVWHPIGSTCRYCEGPLFPVNKGSGSGTAHVLPLRCENRDCDLFDQSQPPFSGILHGNGKTIKGLKLTGGDEALYRGLFGYLNTAYIHDLTIRIANTEDDWITYAGTDLAVEPHIGTVAGLARSARIENVLVGADVLDSGIAGTPGLYVAAPAISSNGSYIGGIIGQGIDSSLKDVRFSVPLDVTGLSKEYVGGIAGYSTGGIESAAVTGQGITVNNTGGPISYLAGISPSALFLRNCTVKITNLKLDVGATASSSAMTASLAGIGYPTTAGEMPTGCDVNINLIHLFSTDAADTGGSRTYVVGGITAATYGSTGISKSIEGNRVRFGKIEVKNENGKYSTPYIGGLVGWLSAATTEVRDCVVEAGEIDVQFLNTASNTAIYVGGIAGQGKIVNSRIEGGLNMKQVKVDATTSAAFYAGGLTGNGAVENSSINGPLVMNVTTAGSSGALYTGGLTGNGAVTRGGIADTYTIAVTSARTGAINVGGLTGSGISQYGFAGTPAGTSQVSVTKATGAGAVNVGGISGTATPTTTALFQYNYAFCNVALTTAGTVSPYAGGLLGNLAGTVANAVTENYFKGDVTVTNNTSNNSAAFAGGIASRSSTATIAQCAVLGGSVTIGGTSSGAKNAGRILGVASTVTIGNNITTISGDSYTDSLTGKDGLYVAEVTQDTFFGTEANQLGWNTDVWEWDEASGYPRLIK
jgi:hypothetical protein